MRFWDSSALVALFLEQGHSTDLRALFRRDRSVLAWVLSDVEFRSAVMRLSREGKMNGGDVMGAISRFESFWLEVRLVPLVEAVKGWAKRFLSVHALKAADALQLGAVYVASAESPAALEFVCLDQRLGRAARLEGFSVVP